MKSIAILPLRKGSKGIPNKNKKKILGRPLYQWVLGEAILSDLDEIYVFSDDRELLSKINSIYTWTDKVKTYERSAESATDTASTELGMKELAEGISYGFDIYSLLQATSPFTTYEDINHVLNVIKSGGADSALTVVESKRFFWTKHGKELNYDYNARPRRQDFEGVLVENGAVYAISKSHYVESHNRLGGRIQPVLMPEDSVYEIDEPADWTVVEQLLKNRLQQLKGEMSNIKYLVLDVDGVFSPGTVQVSGEGELSKTFSLRDGMGLEIAREEGLEIIVMTSEASPIVDQRMKKLNIEHYFKWAKDKFTLINKLCLDFGITRSEIAYVGDDVNDLSNLLSVGLSMCPNDGIDEVKVQVDIVLHANGGDKAIREAVHHVLRWNKRFRK